MRGCADAPRRRASRSEGPSTLGGSPDVLWSGHMKLHSVSLDVDAQLYPPQECPVCSRGELETVASNGTVLFVCRPCGRRWRQSSTWLRDADGTAESPAFRTHTPSAS